MADPRKTVFCDSDGYFWDPQEHKFARWVTIEGNHVYIFLPYEEDDARNIGREHFGHTITSASPKKAEEIKNTMAKNYENHLAKHNDRPVLPDREKSDDSLEEGDDFKPYMPKYANMVVDMYCITVDGKGRKFKWLKQRRFFDSEGRAYQDIDYDHDKHGTHIFPHIHIWIWNGSNCKRSRPFPYLGENGESVLYRKKQNHERKKMKKSWDPSSAGDAWQEENGITSVDMSEVDEHFPHFTMRDVQIALSCGREFELEYKGVQGFCQPSDSGWSLYSHWNGKEIDYVNEDLDDFARYASFGPYSFRDVIDDCTITWLA